MTIDFGALPPEINSGRMYGGPGSGSLTAAAAAWDGLAAELSSTASGYTSVINELTTSWLGPASRSMVAAATPYVAWLSTSAGIAEEAGNQARSAAAAFESAFELTVPPPVIAANRVLLATLVATNFFGQNLPAIALTEAQYAEMWAQDATAMYGYAASSAVASVLNAFTEPTQTTNEGGVNDQAAAVSQAVATQAANTTAQATTAAPQSAATVNTSSITSAFTSLNQAIQGYLTPIINSPWDPLNSWLVQQVAQLNVTNRVALSRGTVGLGYFSAGIMSFFGSIAQQTTFGAGATAGAGGAWYPTPQFAGLGLAGVGGHPFAASAIQPMSAVSANLASSSKIGALSVPSSWGGPPPGAMEESAVAKAFTADYVTDPRGVGTSGLLRGMPMGAGGRRTAGAWPPREYGFKRSVLARPPSAG